MAFTTPSPSPRSPLRAVPPLAPQPAETQGTAVLTPLRADPEERPARPARAQPTQPARRTQRAQRPRHRRQPERAADPAPGATTAPAIHPSLVARLAVLAYEVLEGLRSPVQLHGMITEEVATELRERSTARAETRTVNRDHRRRVPNVSRVLLTRPDPRAVEATAVLEAGMRVHAVAVRLEFSGARQQWIAHCLTVL